MGPEHQTAQLVRMVNVYDMGSQVKHSFTKFATPHDSSEIDHGWAGARSTSAVPHRTTRDLRCNRVFGVPFYLSIKEIIISLERPCAQQTKDTGEMGIVNTHAHKQFATALSQACC